MNSYEQGKDGRTDAQYKIAVTDGIKKQNEVIKRIPWQIKITDPKEKFKTSGTWAYQPDGKLYTSIGWVPLEIKVSDYDTEEFDLKTNQIDKLSAMNGVVLYVAKEKYFFVKAATVREQGEFIKAEDSKVKHESYRLKRDNFKWFNLETK